MQQGVPQLVAWPISGNPMHHEEFLHRVQTSCSLRGETKPTPSFSRWASWCQQRGRDPLTGPIEDVVNFLAKLHSDGYKYQSLNAYRSAISSTHKHVDGVSVGSHPTVSQLLQGAFNSRPPQPRYASFWDVGVVIQYIKGLGNNKDLSLKQLTMKTVMLLALTKPSRSADLSKLDLQTRSFKSNGVVFRPTQLAKQSRSSKPIADFFFPSFAEDNAICPVTSREQKNLGLTCQVTLDLSSSCPL